MSENEILAVPRSGKRELNKATNRTAILAAARLVFAELGYGATTVRDIIRRTGLASGTFYNYFRSKEEVFEAVLDDMALRMRPRLREARERARSFDDFVRGSFRVFFEFCYQDSQDFAVLRSNADHLRIRMNTREVIEGVAELKEDMAKAIAAGLLPPVDVDYLAAALLGVAREMAEELLRRPNPDVAAAVEFATSLASGGIAALPRLAQPKV